MRLILQQANKCPPWLCRIVARKCRGRRLMTNSDLAIVARMSRSTVSNISKKLNWNTVNGEAIQAFSLACGVNLMSLKRTKEFIKRRKAEIWKRCTPAQRRMVDRFIGNARPKQPTAVG